MAARSTLMEDWTQESLRGDLMHPARDDAHPVIAVDCLLVIQKYRAWHHRRVLHTFTTPFDLSF